MPDPAEDITRAIADALRAAHATTYTLQSAGVPSRAARALIDGAPSHIALATAARALAAHGLRLAVRPEK